MGGKRCSNCISTTLPRTEATEPRFEVLGLSPMHFPQQRSSGASGQQSLLMCHHCCIDFFLVRRICPSPRAKLGYAAVLLVRIGCASQCVLFALRRVRSSSAHNLASRGMTHMREPTTQPI